ncbi:PAAR domain-containing protein [Phytobacter sp. V91]|uniref:PAAR domain-containing protein n=1 Tax=Phytobacter sp. V91 TaxID=3369425 RepID=UPI003F5DC426
MTAFQAARVDDPIAHTASKSWMIAGLIGGALLGAATIMTGGAALVVVSAVAAGACAGGGLGEVLGSMSWAPRHVTGSLREGSPNVYVNSRRAIRAHLSSGKCEEHSGSLKRVAEGSIKIYINNYPAGRTGDRLTCSAEIFAGSPNVFFGGEKIQTDDISPEIPGWINWVMLGVGTAAVAVLASPAIALLSMAGGMAGGTGGNWLGGMLFGEGSDGQKWSMLLGSLIGGGLGAKGGAKFDGMLAARAAKVVAEPVAVEPVATISNKPSMTLAEAKGEATATRWTQKGRELADMYNPKLSERLSDDEVGALYGYTTNPGYTEANMALRGQIEMTPQRQAYIDHINQGLDKLPVFKGETLRGTDLPPDILAKNQVGEIVSDPAFMSSDRVKPFEGPTQITIEGTSGRQIDFLSHYKMNNETEVLFKPGTKFEVLERTDINGTTYLKYKEL